MLQTVEAEIDVNGVVHLNEPIYVTEKTPALVTVLKNATPISDKGNVAEILALLRSPEFANRKSYSAEEIDEQIREIRESWE